MQNLAVRILINPLPPRCQEENAVRNNNGDAYEFAYFLIENNDFCMRYKPARAFSILIYLFDVLYDKRTSAQDA